MSEYEELRLWRALQALQERVAKLERAAELSEPIGLSTPTPVTPEGAECPDTGVERSMCYCGPCSSGGVFPPPAKPALRCAGCQHPVEWHEPDPDTGEGPRECSPPDGAYCPCLDLVPATPPTQARERIDCTCLHEHEPACPQRKDPSDAK